MSVQSTILKSLAATLLPKLIEGVIPKLTHEADAWYAAEKITLKASVKDLIPGDTWDDIAWSACEQIMDALWGILKSEFLNQAKLTELAKSVLV